MGDPIDKNRVRATTVLTLILAALLAVTVACGPDKSVPPSPGPWAACPNGEHRIKDGWLDWRAQWVCE